MDRILTVTKREGVISIDSEPRMTADEIFGMLEYAKLRLQFVTTEYWNGNAKPFEAEKENITAVLDAKTSG